MSIKSKVFAAAATLTLVARRRRSSRLVRQRGHPVLWPELR